MIEIGKITGTHGLKGELKVMSEFEKQDEAFQVGVPIYIDDKKHIISSHRIHQKKHLITLDYCTDINELEDLRGKIIFIRREDLPYKGHLMIDYVSFQVYEQDELIGVVIDVLETEQGPLLKVMNHHPYYIPFYAPFLLDIDYETKKILVTGGKELEL